LIRLLSVMHTGTRFVAECLKNSGYVQTDSYYGQGDFVQCHFDGRGNAPIIYNKPGMVIIPLRDFGAVKKSWESRGSNLAELDRCWEEMCEWIQERGRGDVFLLHVDDPDCRDEELREMGERLDTYLIADFSEKVGHVE
jgi:hypothetical protein